jgi:hypothetical protein
MCVPVAPMNKCGINVMFIVVVMSMLTLTNVMVVIFVTSVIFCCFFMTSVRYSDDALGVCDVRDSDVIYPKLNFFGSCYRYRYGL